MDELELQLLLNMGAEGVDSNADNCLSRALNDLLAKGKPYHSHSICYFSKDWPDEEADIRWLGVFIHTVGNRILFFPGISDAGDQVFTTYKENVIAQKPFVIDHITLEIPKKKWHISSKNPSLHHNAGSASELDGNRFLWFGLSVANDDVLQQVHKKTIVRFPTPPSDSERRLDEVIRLHSNAPQNLVGLVPESLERFTPGFFHFTFLVVPRNSGIYTGPQFLRPHHYPGVTPLPDGIDSEFPIRTHQVPLTNNLEVQITSMKFPGEIPRPFIFSSLP